MTPFIGQLKLSRGPFSGLQPFRTDCIVAAPPLVLFDPCAVSLEFMRPCYVYFGGARKRGTRGGRLKIEEIVSNAKRETRSPKENRFARRRRLLFLLEIPRLDSETRRRWWFIFCVDRPVKINRPIVFSTSRLGSFVLPFVSSFASFVDFSFEADFSPEEFNNFSKSSNPNNYIV